LTARERQALHWVAEGKSNEQIARIVGCAEATVKKHLQRIYRKMGVESRTAAAAIYLRACAEVEG
jgi:DNA-binding CsgD family transcriptional regulator